MQICCLIKNISVGNHEYYYGDINEWLHYFTTKFNITVLHNENRNLCSSSGDCICVAGVDDLFTGICAF